MKVKTETQFYVLGHLYFCDLAVPVKCNETGHADQDVNYKIRGQKPITKQIDSEFKRFNPDDSDFNIF